MSEIRVIKPDGTRFHDPYAFIVAYENSLVIREYIWSRGLVEKKITYMEYRKFESMEEALEFARNIARKGGVVEVRLPLYTRVQRGARSRVEPQTVFSK